MQIYRKHQITWKRDAGRSDVKYDETSKNKLGNHTNESSSVIHERKIGLI